MESLTSEALTSPPSVNYEPSENTVSMYYTPPWQTLSDGSPLVDDTAASGSPVTTGGYKKIPVSEPDLSKVPERSALKGGKTRHLEEKRRGKENKQKQVALSFSVDTDTIPPHPAAVQFNSTGAFPRVPPKVAPKPRIGP